MSYLLNRMHKIQEPFIDKHFNSPIMSVWAGLCPICKKGISVEVEDKGLEKYKKGAYVQDAFPNMSVNDRELIISGMCSQCWDEMIGDDDEY
jgi:hypothetical protein